MIEPDDVGEPEKRAIALSPLILASFVDDVRGFLWTHPWWHAVVVLVPPVLVAAFFSWRELRHSKEANRLRTEANDSRTEANNLRAEANHLRDELKNAVARIADNTKKVPTQAEKSAAKLRKYLRQRARE
jgi:uncharacterized protein YlxW (UPF0749 family)